MDTLTSTGMSYNRYITTKLDIFLYYGEIFSAVRYGKNKQVKCQELSTV